MFGEYNYIIRPIIPAELILDIDVGIICTIQKKYCNPEYFDTEFLNHMSFNDIVNRLFQRTEMNPLSIIAKDTLSKESQQKIYDELLETERDTVMKYSIKTAFGDFIANAAMMPGIIATVLCRDETELSFFENHEDMKPLKKVLKDKDFNYSHYNVIYTKYVTDLPKNLDALNIYLTEHKYNYIVVDGEEVLRPEIIDLSKHNSIAICEIYRKNEVNENVESSNE